MERIVAAPGTTGSRALDCESAPSRQAGYTLTEILVVLMIVSILSVIALGMMDGRIAKARLARCMIELRSIQSTVFTHSGGGWPLPDQRNFWDVAWSGVKPGPYFYLVDNDDPNNGHGNDLDGFDEGNPGGAPRPDKDIHFVLLCQHYHGSLAWYVYLEDEGSPRIATAQDNPKYHRFIHWIDNPPGGGGGGKPPR